MSAEHIPYEKSKEMRVDQNVGSDQSDFFLPVFNCVMLAS